MDRAGKFHHRAPDFGENERRAGEMSSIWGKPRGNAASEKKEKRARPISAAQAKFVKKE